jgi:gas vesicle protein
MYVEHKDLNDSVRDLTKTVNVYLEDTKIDMIGKSVNEIESTIVGFVKDLKEQNEILEKNRKEEMEKIKSSLNEKFDGLKSEIDEKKVKDEEIKKTESETLDKKLKGIELNIKGLSEGIKPGDEGLEDRLCQIETNLESIAKDLKTFVVDISSESGESNGRDPKVMNEAKNMAIKRSLVMRAFNKSVEALNILNKE